MKSQNGKSPSKGTRPAQAAVEPRAMAPAPIVESRRIPKRMTRRPLTIEAAPMTRARTANQNTKRSRIPYPSSNIWGAQLR